MFLFICVALFLLLFILLLLPILFLFLLLLLVLLIQSFFSLSIVSAVHVACLVSFPHIVSAFTVASNSFFPAYYRFCYCYLSPLCSRLLPSMLLLLLLLLSLIFVNAAVDTSVVIANGSC